MPEPILYPGEDSAVVGTLLAMGAIIVVVMLTRVAQEVWRRHEGRRQAAVHDQQRMLLAFQAEAIEAQAQTISSLRTALELREQGFLAGKVCRSEKV